MSTATSTKPVTVRQIATRIRRQAVAVTTKTESRHVHTPDFYNPETDEWFNPEVAIFVSYHNGNCDDIGILGDLMLHRGVWYPRTEEGWAAMYAAIKEKSVQY